MTVDQLKERIEYWMEVMNLGHWILDLHVIHEADDEDEDYWAKVEPSGYYEKFEMWVTYELLERDDEFEIEVTIVHELVHVLMRDHDENVEAMFDSGLMSLQQVLIMRTVFKKSTEALVDKVARMFVKLDRARVDQ